MKYSPLFLEYCQQLPISLTSLRKAVLFCLWQSNKPLKAYEIVELLMVIKPNITPPTVYRVLDFFTQHGILHKIDPIQSYTLCSAPNQHLPSEILMLCTTCHHVTEVYNAKARALLTQVAALNRFVLSVDAIALQGQCVNCT